MTKESIVIYDDKAGGEVWREEESASLCRYTMAQDGNPLKSASQRSYSAWYSTQLLIEQEEDIEKRERGCLEHGMLNTADKCCIHFISSPIEAR